MTSKTRKGRDISRRRGQDGNFTNETIFVGSGPGSDSSDEWPPPASPTDPPPQPRLPRPARGRSHLLLKKFVQDVRPTISQQSPPSPHMSLGQFIEAANPRFATAANDSFPLFNFPYQSFVVSHHINASTTTCSCIHACIPCSFVLLFIYYVCSCHVFKTDSSCSHIHVCFALTFTTLAAWITLYIVAITFLFLHI